MLLGERFQKEKKKHMVEYLKTYIRYVFKHVRLDYKYVLIFVILQFSVAVSSIGTPFLSHPALPTKCCTILC